LVYNSIQSKLISKQQTIDLPSSNISSIRLESLEPRDRLKEMVEELGLQNVDENQKINSISNRSSKPATARSSRSPILI